MKKIFTVFASVAMVFAMSSCDGNKSNKNEQENTDTTEQVVDYTETCSYHSGDDASDIQIRMPKTDSMIESILLVKDGATTELKMSENSDADTYIYVNADTENPLSVTMRKNSEQVTLKEGDKVTEYMLVDPIKREYTNKDGQSMLVVYRHLDGDKTVAEVSYDGKNYELPCTEAANSAATYEKDNVSLNVKDNKATLKVDNATVEFDETPANK